MQFSKRKIFYCPSKEEPNLKSTSQSEMKLPYSQMYLKFRHYRASHAIVSFHRNETDQTKSMKYTFWLPGVPNKALQGLGCREGIFLEG